MNVLGKRSDLPFSRKGDRKKEKSTVSFTHVQNIICSQAQLDGSRGGRGGLPANEKKKKFLRMIIWIIYTTEWRKWKIFNDDNSFWLSHFSRNGFIGQIRSKT